MKPPASTTILGIETSCDETAAAVLDGEGHVLANVISSQQTVHERFGGVVPELASRAHIQNVDHVTRQALDAAGLTWQDLGAIAVTQGPGLAGALLVGISYAKSLAYALGIPLVGVSHLEGHIASAWIDRPSFPRTCVVLIASGGHTHLFHATEHGGFHLMGRTIDDAAGEAFDKGAQMLGLGYPGGPLIDAAARKGSPAAVRFPRSRVRTGQLDFSFTGRPGRRVPGSDRGRVGPSDICGRATGRRLSPRRRRRRLGQFQAASTIDGAGSWGGDSIGTPGPLILHRQCGHDCGGRATGSGAGQAGILRVRSDAELCVAGIVGRRNGASQILTFEYQGASPSPRFTDTSPG